MKVESMASKKRPSRTQTDPTELRAGKIVERRATTPGIFTNEQQETNRNSSRRKLSADNTHRSLFPKTARTSELYPFIILYMDIYSASSGLLLRLQHGYEGQFLWL